MYMLCCQGNPIDRYCIYDEFWKLILIAVDEIIESMKKSNTFSQSYR